MYSKLWLKNLRGRDNLGDLRIQKWIILKWILRTSVKLCTGLKCIKFEAFTVTKCNDVSLIRHAGMG